MHRHHAFGFSPGPAPRRFEGLGGQQAQAGIDVGENHLRAAEPGRGGGGEEGDGRDDTDVSWAEVQGREGEMQRGGAARAGDGLRCADRARERRLEFADLGPVRKAFTAQGGDDRGHVGLVDEMTAVGEEILFGLRLPGTL